MYSCIMFSEYIPDPLQFKIVSKSINCFEISVTQPTIFTEHIIEYYIKMATQKCIADMNHTYLL